MPGKSHPATKLQAETPLTPARSFRDEDLATTSCKRQPSCLRKRRKGGNPREPDRARGLPGNKASSTGSAKNRLVSLTACRAVPYLLVTNVTSQCRPYVPKHNPSGGARGDARPCATGHGDCGVAWRCAHAVPQPCACAGRHSCKQPGRTIPAWVRHKRGPVRGRPATDHELTALIEAAGRSHAALARKVNTAAAARDPGRRAAAAGPVPRGRLPWEDHTRAGIPGLRRRPR
jgi:hypothetical protein